MTPGAAVQICRPYGNSGGYTLDRPALNGILSQNGVSHTPVAIYSLAGAFRKGKSLMLNLFLRHLCGGRKVDSLQKSGEIISGFAARGGNKKCTEGIWMWNQPFFTEDGKEKVAIFLVDTQGTFDHQSSIQGVSLIFSLSTLISSVQIFNIMQQIQENDLQNLQLFTEYGQMAKRGASGMHGTPFQSLLFLIRDWQDPDYEYGLMDGDRYLKSVLERGSPIKEVEEVRKNISHSFENLGCFLMPHPGMKIARRGKDAPPATLKEAEDEFVGEVQNLVRYLFTEKITRKQVNGKMVTGNDLIFLIGAYCDQFESGKMPKIDNIVEASAKASLLALVGKMADSYDDNMKKECDKGPMEPLQMKALHDRMKARTLKAFDTQPKMGSARMVQEYQKNLSDLLDSHRPLFESINAAQKSAKEMKATQEQMAEMRKQFDKAMKEQSDLYVKQMAESDAKWESLYNELKNQKRDQGSCIIL